MNLLLIYFKYLKIYRNNFLNNQSIYIYLKKKITTKYNLDAKDIQLSLYVPGGIFIYARVLCLGG